MRGIFKLIFLVGVNALALYVASRYVPGFSAPVDLKDLLFVSLILTVLNVVLKPILDAVFMPINWLTLGFTSFVISGLMVFILDNLSEKVTINGPSALLLGTIIIGLTNAICSHLLFQKS